MQKAVYLLLLWSMISPRAFSQNKEEQELIQKADNFITANKDQWNDLNKQMDAQSDTATQGRALSFRIHPFYKAFKTFIEKNAALYATARTARLSQYAPPPPALTALSWHKASSLSGDNGSLDLLSVTFIRSFEPSVPVYLVYGILMPAITASTYATIEEVQNYYRKRDLFGTRIYAMPSAGDDWQIWAADRSFALTFHFNAGNGILSDIQYSLPNDPSYASISWTDHVIKQSDEATRLSADMVQVIWNIYPGKSYDPLNYTAYTEQRNEALQHFYQQNHQRFITVRENYLKALDKPLADLPGYRELTKPGDQIMQHADTTYPASTYLYPSQWEIAIKIAAGQYFELSTADIAKRVQYDALYGSRHYAKQSEAHEWEVWTISNTSAVCYVWNTDTGHIRGVRYWTKAD